MDAWTKKVQRKYDRIAWLYNLLESPMSWGGLNKWRQQLWQKARGRVLEVGVGAGANFSFYPEGVEVTAIDFSPRMLAKARERAKRLGLKVHLRQMDVQQMDFPDDSFDTVVTTCVFCTVPDPIKGLQEIRRVCCPDGRVLMLEHVRSCRPVVGRLMDWLNPIPRFLLGTNINRDTVGNLEKAGLKVLEVQKLWSDILLQILALPNK